MSTITRSGSCLRTALEQLLPAAGLTDDFIAGPLQEACRPFAMEDVVVRQDAACRATIIPADEERARLRWLGIDRAEDHVDADRAVDVADVGEPVPAAGRSATGPKPTATRRSASVCQ
jgi:hypothetical protein